MSKQTEDDLNKEFQLVMEQILGPENKVPNLTLLNDNTLSNLLGIIESELMGRDDNFIDYLESQYKGSDDNFKHILSNDKWDL